MLKRLIPENYCWDNINQDHFNKLIPEFDTEKNVQEQYFKCIFRYRKSTGVQGISATNSKAVIIAQPLKHLNLCKKTYKCLELHQQDNINLFSIYAELLCKSCNDFWANVSGCVHRCHCGDEAYMRICIKNAGAPVNVDIDVGIENLSDLRITNLFNVTRNLNQDDIIQKDWQFLQSRKRGSQIKDKDHNGMFVVHGGDYFSSPSNYGCYFTLLCRIKPHQVSCNSQYPSTFTQLAGMFSDDNINPAGPLVDKQTDVILLVGSNKIHCHRLILGIGSKVFERMFASNMKESKSQEIELKEVDLETITSLISFIYQDKIEDEKITPDLLATADRFEVLRLKNICSFKLAKVIDKNNVAQIWHCAYLHNEENLAYLSVMYMVKRWKKLSDQTEIIELCTKYPDLLYTISILLAECLSSNSE